MIAKLEVVVVPVSDVDRAAAFYAAALGFAVDHDATTADGRRLVQRAARRRVPGSAVHRRCTRTM